MRNTPTCNYEPPDIITSAWVINYWLIDANTYVLSPLMNTSVSTLKPIIISTQLEANATIEAENKYLLARTESYTSYAESRLFSDSSRTLPYHRPTSLPADAVGRSHRSMSCRPK